MDKQQAQFIADDFLKRFKDRYVLVDADTLPIIEKILAVAGAEFNKRAVDNLQKSGAIDTGGLTDLASPVVYQSGDNSYTLEIGYPISSAQAKYYDYINKGVQGLGGVGAKLKKTSGQYKFKYRTPSKKMISALADWAKRQSLSVKADKLDLSKVQRKRRKIAKALDKFKSSQRLGNILARAIKKNGIKATYYFDRAVKQTFDKKFQASLETALKNDIVLQIRSTYGNNN